jgi:predicted ATPase
MKLQKIEMDFFKFSPYRYNENNNSRNIELRALNVLTGLNNTGKSFFAEKITSMFDIFDFISYPEHFLHPKMQVEKTREIVKKYKESEKSCLLETHSDHVLHSIKVCVKEGFIKKEEVQILFFEKKDNYFFIQQIFIDKNGTLSDHPIGLLDEISNQLCKLL